MPHKLTALPPCKKRIKIVSRLSFLLCAKNKTWISFLSQNSKKASYLKKRAASSIPDFLSHAVFSTKPLEISFTVQSISFPSLLRLEHKSTTKLASPSVSFLGRILWFTVITCKITPSGEKILQSETKRDTESAPPETPTAIFSRFFKPHKEDFCLQFKISL